MKKNETTPSQLILASGSPRRKQILTLLGIPYTTKVSNADESMPIPDPLKHVIHYAILKAETIATQGDDALVLGADTVVAKGKTIYGKPKSKTDARRILTELSGKKHQVITGVALVDAVTGKTWSGYEVTDVYFNKVTPRAIRAYVETGEPMDKAGAYGIQEKGCFLVKKIDGCFFNVVGLPVTKLLSLLDTAGFEPRGEYTDAAHNLSIL